MPTGIEKILAEREHTHGRFQSVSGTYGKLFEAVRPSQWAALTDTERMAYQMILVKLSRIVSTEHYNSDNWLDIVGYATLVLSNEGRHDATKG